MSDSSQQQAGKKVVIHHGKFVTVTDFLDQAQCLLNQKRIVAQLSKQLCYFEKELTKSQSGQEQPANKNDTNRIKLLEKQLLIFEEEQKMSESIQDHHADMIRLLRTQVNLMTDTLTYIVRRSSDGYAINAAAKVLDICEASKGD
jgi:lipid II:glycine glycyltransferase (peptidoglycan interpeptide bridge formation enzyme)